MKQTIILFFFSLLSLAAQAWPGMPMYPLHVEGRQLVDSQGHTVVLHGVGQTYSPWFNERGRYWDHYDVEGCLRYNQRLLHQMVNERGWRINWLRLHMDPYWSNTPGVRIQHGEADISAFSMERFEQYFASVFMPMARYARGLGLYVVMRPPGVCPHIITPGDEYQRYLVQVWSHVARQLATNADYADIAPYIMLELANEPVRVDGHITAYFQAVVDAIRAQGFEGVLWIPGAGYQSHYAEYARQPIHDHNFGYAIHCYPGWYSSDCYDRTPEAVQYEKSNGFPSFLAEWEKNVGCVASHQPILLTEMDWSSFEMGCSWGKAWTGERGGRGFGANLKYIMDLYGNISWMIFTGTELLAQYDDAVPNGTSFLDNPEACPRPAYRWFAQYAAEWPVEQSRKAQRLRRILFNDGLALCAAPGQTVAAPIDGQYADGHTVCINARCQVEVADTTVATYRFGTLTFHRPGHTTLCVEVPGQRPSGKFSLVCQ